MGLVDELGMLLHSSSMHISNCSSGRTLERILLRDVARGNVVLGAHFSVAGLLALADLEAQLLAATKHTVSVLHLRR